MLDFIQFLLGNAPSIITKPKDALDYVFVPSEGRNPLMFQFFEWDNKTPWGQTWWQYFESQVPVLAELGVTQVWLPPPNKGMSKNGRGYDAYDLWDLGEFYQKGTTRTRWGGKDDLIQAVATAKRYGIDILIDAVINHKLGADSTEAVPAIRVDPLDRNREIGKLQTIQAHTSYRFSGRGDKYSKMKWSFEHFTGVDIDARWRTRGVFRIEGPGKREGWSQFVDTELGNYDYLLGSDIDHRHSDVQQDLLAWGQWVLETTGASGFRLDAIKHMDRRFVRDFVRHARALPGKENLFAVGEYWSTSADSILKHMKDFDGQLCFFDVPLHDNLYNASRLGHRYDLRKIFDNTLAKICPGDACTFVDNHDTVPGQSLQSWIEAPFKPLAYAITLLRPHGYTCVFYKDIYDKSNPTLVKKIKLLMKARRNVAYGPIRDYSDGSNCLGWVRDGDEKHPGGCVVVISNARSGSGVISLRMDVGITSAGSRYHNVASTSSKDAIEDVTIGNDGWGVFKCRAMDVSVWTKAEL